MPSKINRLARGLTDVLDIKALGQGPNALLDEVRVTMDGTPLFLAGQEWSEFGQTNTAVVGFVSLITVPAMESWLLAGYTVTAPTAAGEAIRMRAGISAIGARTSGGAFAATLALGQPGTAAALQRIWCNADGLPLILSPGDTLLALVEQITTAGTITISGSARYYKLGL